MRLYGRALVLALFVSFASATIAEAQTTQRATGKTCFICSVCWIETGQGNVLGHIVANGPAPSGVFVEHGDCEVDPPCPFDHPTCPDWGFVSITPEQQQEMQTLVYLAARGDTDAVASLLADYGDYTSVRLEDKSLLVASICSSEPGVYSHVMGLTEDQFQVVASS